MSGFTIKKGFVEQDKISNIINFLEIRYNDVKEWYEEIKLDSNYTMLRLEFKNEIVGICIYSLDEEKFTGKINTLFIEKEFRKLGFGSVFYKMSVSDMKCRCSSLYHENKNSKKHLILKLHMCGDFNNGIMAMLLKDEWRVFEYNPEENRLDMLKVEDLFSIY